MKKEITSGVIWQQILLFFFPILFGTFFQQLYNTIDAILVTTFRVAELLELQVVFFAVTLQSSLDNFSQVHRFLTDACYRVFSCIVCFQQRRNRFKTFCIILAEMSERKRTEFFWLISTVIYLRFKNSRYNIAEK